jgi:RNA polymerase sigma-70 factor (ECF subfamily)
MTPLQRQELELDLRRRCDARDFNGAATVALRGYGREILEFLTAFHRSETDASEVFSLFTDALWQGLERFAWTSSFRTWAYAIARYVSYSYRRDAGRRERLMGAPLPDSTVAAVAEQVRTETLSYLRTERRTRIVELRDTLPPEDRVLLMLRVDRELTWNDLARVLHDGEAELDDEILKREAARLRKRFQLIKEKIYEMARHEGLVDTAKDGRKKPRS